MRYLKIVLCAAMAVAGVSLHAQRPVVGNQIRRFVTVDAPVVALTHARVLDGTGAPARGDQTLIIRDGKIAALGASASTPVPEGATVIDLTGKTVMPGMVMVHEHLYYPTGPGVYGQLGESFVNLYLAGGVTTMRTGGNVNGFMDINMKKLIDAGSKAGPSIDATAPYLNGPNSFQQMRELKGPDDARRQVNYWADEGATSFKAYMAITRADLGAAIDEAHKRGLKVTGHLCSVTLSEAADLGIDNVEHAFMASTDFVADKKPDTCPGQGVGQRSIADLSPSDPRFLALVKKLIAKGVTLTTTPAVFETFTPGRPLPPGLEVLVPQLREQFERGHASTAKSTTSVYTKLFPNGLALDLAFFRAGGNISPNASLTFHVRPGSIVYATAGRGYKAGGFNPTAPPSEESYGEESTWTVEGGTKTSFADGRVIANAAVFYIDWTDLQLNLPIPTAPGQFYISNVGGATSRGAELELMARAAAGVDIFGSLGVTRARFSEGSSSSGADVSDNRLPFTPEFTASVGMQVNRQIRSNIKAFGRAELVRYGKFDYDDANSAGQEAYSLANFRAGVDVRGVTIEGWVRNAFDTRYIPTAFSYPLFAQSGFVGETGRPRTLGITLGVGF